MANYHATCTHGNEKLVFIVSAAGKRMYQNQCQTCGEKGEWIPHAALAAQDKESATERQDIKGLVREAEKDYKDEQKAQEEAEKKAEYDRYLESFEWKRRRRRRMEINDQLFGGYCEICLNRKATECHHVTYLRLYREWQFDLACLCRECHEEQHQVPEALERFEE